MIRYTGHIVFLIVVGLSAATRAQSSPAPAAAPAPDAAQTGAAAVPPAAPVSGPAPDVAARLDDIEQTARIALRKHELLEEEAAKRAKEAPKLAIDDKGFSMALPDKSYVLKFHALMQADGRFFFNNDTLEANDTFLIRRFRPSIDGTLFSIVDFKLLPEFAGTVQILDAYVDLHPRDWLRLRFGKYKPPVGLERLQSDADLPVLERALDQNLSASRDIGVQLWGDIAGGIVHYVIGVFNGAIDTNSADNADFNHAKDFEARLFIRPFKTDRLKELGNLGVGISVDTGNRKGRLPTATTLAVTGLAPFRTAGMNTFFQYLAPSIDTTGAQATFTHERSTRINPQLYYYCGGFGLLGEYLWLKQGVQKGNDTAALTQQGAHATVSYTLWGSEGYDGATPAHDFDPGQGHWGALQLAFRYGWLGIDDATFPTYANPAVSARSAQAFTGGAAWVLRRSVRLAVNYEETLFKGGAGTAAMITNRPTEYLLLVRAQVNF